jgi:two-component system, chemotaxis family, protein-glutamate methylesterase/glutaminase
MKPVRTLIVDDSATMRSLIRAALSRDRDIEVVGEATNPIEAREAIKALAPDVMTLDVEMPKMDGLEFLEKVMRLRPFPVVMVSVSTAQGTAAAIAALELGAVSCVGKPTTTEPKTFDELAAKVKTAACAHVDRRPDPEAFRPAASSAGYQPDGRIVAIGASTGGVEALVAVVSRFPGNCPPTVITIHMPAPFTTSFAKRLDGLTDAQVCEAVDGAVLGPGRILVAPGGPAHLEIAGSRDPHCRLKQGGLVNGHRPSVDVLFHSVAKTCGANALGVILTGMGRDGAGGLLAMRRAGARTLGQDEATSIIYGMPKAAFEIGAVEKQAPLHGITSAIIALTSTYPSRSMNHVARG